jgi:hypothetical protein
MQAMKQNPLSPVSLLLNTAHPLTDATPCYATLSKPMAAFASALKTAWTTPKNNHHRSAL